MPKQHNTDPTQKLITLPKNLSTQVRNNLTSNEALRCTIINKKDGKAAELLIYEQIGEDSWTGEGVTAKSVVEFLSKHEDQDIIVRINSPGGLAFDGITIANALMSHAGSVTTIVEGIAASSATIIAAAADIGKAKMHKNALYFIHKALGIVVGNEKVMRDTAKFLDQLDKQIAATLSARSHLSRSAVLDLMAGNVDGTTFNAEETLENGFVDEIILLNTADDENEEDDDNNKNNIRNQQKMSRARAVEARMRVLNIGRDILDINSD